MRCILDKLTALPLLVAALVLFSCSKDEYFDFDTSRASTVTSESRKSPGRTVFIDRNVMIMVFGGRNSLSSYLKSDLAELENSKLPVGNYASSHALLILSRIGGTYSEDTPAALYQLYKGPDNEIVRDTLMVWDGFTPLFGDSVLHEALEYIWDEFPAKGYGLVLSSHGSGYLPAGYYYDPGAFENSNSQGGGSFWISPRMTDTEEFEPIPEYPAVKSFGEDRDVISFTGTRTVEMEIQELEEAIPFHMDYILFDACLMATVEVAYQLKDKTDYVGFSPTEVMANGFNYNTITTHLLKDIPDPEQVCRDYIATYKDPSYPEPWATVSLVSTDGLDHLASVCRDLFEKYRVQMANVDANSIQRYFRANRHFFYDLKDIMVKSGISSEDLEELDAALDATVIYKDCTENFMTIRMNNYNGLSMYLPCMGAAYLESYYKNNVDWNEATELVKTN